MRKMMLLAVVVAIAALMMAAAPAMAQDRDWNDHRDNDDFCDFFDCDEDDFFDRDFDLDDLDFDSDQDAVSGNVDQTFVVTNTGDNSNQCVGLQGVANTGNVQNQSLISQLGSDADDFDFDGGSSIDLDPTNVTTCDQQVNQAATASYDDGGGTYNYYYNYYYPYYW